MTARRADLTFRRAAAVLFFCLCSSLVASAQKPTRTAIALILATVSCKLLLS